MKTKNKRKIFVIALSALFVISSIFIYFTRNGSNNSLTPPLKDGYQEASICGPHHMYRAVKTGFKTRDGGTEGGKIVVSLGEPPIGRKAETFKIDIFNIGDETNSLLTAEIKEGETIQLENDLKAGSYYTLGISKPDAPERKEYIFTYYWSPDESSLDIPRPYAG